MGFLGRHTDTAWAFWAVLLVPLGIFEAVLLVPLGRFGAVRLILREPVGRSYWYRLDVLGGPIGTAWAFLGRSD